MTETPPNNPVSQPGTSSKQTDDNTYPKNKVTYTSRFYIVLVSLLLVGFLFVNILTVLSGAYLALIATFVQLTVLFFIVSKNIQVKLGLKIWGGLMVLTGGLKLFSMLLYFISQRPDMVDSPDFYKSTIYLLFGVLIVVFAEKTIKVPPK